MQVGKGVTPIKQRDPMRERLFEQNQEDRQRNALRQDEQDANARTDRGYKDEERKRAESMRAAEQDYGLLNSGGKDPIAQKNAYAKWWGNKQASGADPSQVPGAVDPSQWTPEVTGAVTGFLETKVLGIKGVNQRKDREATAQEKQDNADRLYRLQVDRFNYTKNNPSGGVQITGYDEEGRPLIQMGGAGQQVGPPDRGTVKPASKVVTEAQQGIQSGTQSLAIIDRILEQYKPEYLTYAGRARNAAGVIMDKLGIASPEMKKYIGARRVFTMDVNQEFNQYRKAITGAAAAVQELEDLKKAMIADDLAPSVFERAVDAYRQGIMRSIRIKQKLLREGVRVGIKDFGKKYDTLWKSGGDDDIAERARDLAGQGIGEEEGDAILRAEGYLGRGT